MSLFSIAYRSIVQRGVASLLTMLSMALGVMLVVAVLSIHGVVSQSFKNNASLGYNMIVGAKGGQEQLVLNTVFYLSKPVENIPYTYYLEFLKQADRDRVQAHSIAVEAKRTLDETLLLAEANASQAEGLAAWAAASALDRLALDAIPDTRTRPSNPPVEIGRPGKYGLMTELAIPLCLGDYYGEFRVVGTTPDLFDNLVYDIENNRKFEFAQGRNFEHRNREHGYFEAVVGSTVARQMNVRVGDEISPRHGDPEGHEHARKFTVVGILRPSGTPNDRGVFVNMEGFYLMEDHATPLAEAKPQPDGQASAAETSATDTPSGHPQLTEQQAKEAWERMKVAAKKRAEMELAADPEPLPVEQREVTAILLRVPYQLAPGLDYGINKGPQAQAVLPVAVIHGLFAFIVDPIEWTLITLTGMICVVSGVSILVSIYNSMTERRGEIAVMRALGAGRGTVMTIILLEATLLAVGGGTLGWLAGHAMSWGASPLIEERTGVQIGFFSFEPAFRVLTWLGASGAAAEQFRVPVEVVLLPALVLLAMVVGIWPAISAYRTDVARSLGK
jgi:putative ABC transport system permease protein